jgi:hypothetical protein
MSWDLSKSTIIDGFYFLYIENVPIANSDLQNRRFNLETDWSRFSADENNRIVVQVRSDKIPDTLIIRVYDGFVFSTNHSIPTDSFQLIRVK